MIDFIIRVIIFLGFVFILPIIFIAMLIIFLEDGFPIIFSQKRLGINKKIFNIYKLRTMKINTPNKGTHEISTSNYLYSGFIFRKAKIDELPQILNYLKGNINLIGPRPGLPSQEKLNHFRQLNNVFDVKPGITGLSQVLGYDMSQPELLSKIDNLYITKKSNMLDLQIFLATFFKMFKVKINKTFQSEIKKLSNNV